MLGEPHDLVHEFPEHREIIHNLKMSDRHFARLFEEYNELDKEVRHVEMAGGTVSDEHLEQLKLKRVNLKDQLYAMLQKA